MEGKRGGGRGYISSLEVAPTACAFAVVAVGFTGVFSFCFNASFIVSDLSKNSTTKMNNI